MIKTRITLPPGSAGTGVPFELAIPARAVPTFSSDTHRLSWSLIARSGSFFSTKVEVTVPIEIVDASAAETTAPLTQAPRLGEEQVAAAFASFARSGPWRLGDQGADSEHPNHGGIAIERMLEEGELRIAYAYRGADGTFLTARICHPPIGLGLDVSPSSVRDVFFKDVEVDIAEWDRAHHVVARTAKQAIPFLRGIVPTLLDAEGLGTLVRWSDDEVVFERPVSAVEESDLEWMASDLSVVASVVLAAQRTIAPPPGVTVDLAAWQDLATRLAGRLVVGDLSIDGVLDGVPVHVGLAWDDENRPLRVYASVGDPEAASAKLRGLVLSLPHPATDVVGNVDAEPILEQVRQWPAEIADLRVIEGIASASNVLAPGELPVVDAARARELLFALRSVLVALEPGAGPYR
jgi:hypothetical protein